MKKTIKMLAGVTLMAGSILFSCNSPDKKVENAKEEVAEAEKNLDKANEAYLTEIENYKKETAEKIIANDQYIADFKTKIEHEKKAVKAEYQEKIVLLEQKNKELKQKLQDYKAEGAENWETFKTEFNHDMDELGKAFSDLTIKNVK